MKGIYNATLHKQPASVEAFLEERGYQLVSGEPGGVVVAAGATMTEVREAARAIVYRANIVEYVDAVLVGGLSSLQIAIYAEAVMSNLDVVEVAVDRLRDDSDEFVFKPVSLRVLHHRVMCAGSRDAIEEAMMLDLMRAQARHRKGMWK